MRIGCIKGKGWQAWIAWGYPSKLRSTSARWHLAQSNGGSSTASRVLSALGPLRRLMRLGSFMLETLPISTRGYEAACRLWGFRAMDPGAAPQTSRIPVASRHPNTRRPCPDLGPCRSACASRPWDPRTRT